MELDEIRKRAFLREYMEAREHELAAPKHPCEDMSLEEIFSFVTFLQKRLEEESARNEDIKNWLDNVFDQLVKSQKTNESNAKALVRLIETSENLKEQLVLMIRGCDRLLKENESLRSQNEINKKHRFGSRSQKGVAKKQGPLKGRDEDKDDFDGTPGCVPVSAGEASLDAPESSGEKEPRDYRKGIAYNTMNAQSKRITDVMSACFLRDA